MSYTLNHNLTNENKHQRVDEIINLILDDMNHHDREMVIKTVKEQKRLQTLIYNSGIIHAKYTHPIICSIFELDNETLITLLKDFVLRTNYDYCYRNGFNVLRTDSLALFAKKDGHREIEKYINSLVNAGTYLNVQHTALTKTKRKTFKIKPYRTLCKGI